MFDLYLSYVSTEKKVLDKFWSESQLTDKLRKGSSICKPESQFGRIETLSFRNNKVSKAKACDLSFKPLALHSEGGHLYVSATDNNIYILDECLNIKKKITNPLFNSIHTIRKLDDYYYLSSTGIDALLRTKNTGQEVEIIWKAIDHEYGYFPDGIKRQINYNIAHNKTTYPTLQQTTHINSCEPHIDKNNTLHVFATLFHQGVVLKINPKTGTSEKYIKDLDSPHSFRIYKGHESNLGMLCDSNNNRVLIDIRLDGDGRDYRTLSDNFKWVQDAGIVDNTILWVLDANNYRVAFYDYLTLEHIVDYKFNDTYRVFSAEAIMI